MHHSFSAFSSKPHNSQNQPPPHSNPVKVDIGIRQDSTGITYTGIGQPMDVSIGQAYHREVYYLYDKTKYFIYKCPNQKAQIKVVLHIMNGKEKQVQTDKVRELDIL